MRQLRHLLLVLLAVLPLGVAAPASAQATVATDKAALVALYTATDGANWTTNTNWTSDMALSSWHGVTTNSAGRVTELTLDDNGLDGTLPAALGDLSELEQLDLQDNDLSGALPSELADLTNLTSLLLNESRALTGPLPSGLRELSDLATVNIEQTELCAPDDDAFQTWLATITFSGLICPPDEQSVIDVAVFYTSAARENVGGTDEIATVIDLMVAETNTAYEASGANQRIKLVAVEEVVGYRETNDLAIDIARLRLASDGHMDEIHDIRDAVAADIVLLIPAGLSGRAYQLHVSSTSSESRAFGVVNAYSSSTFAHELGHIMGLYHDRYAECGDNCGGFTRFPYAFGYVNQEALEMGAPDTAFWRTIMAYSNQCGRCSEILRFSNPDQIYPDPGGDPLGKAGLAPAPGADGPADAVRMLNRTRGYVANYRTPAAITVSFDAETYTATEGGTAATVTISLSDAPGRAIDIPFTATSTTGAAASDYTVPRSVAFAANETQQTFTVTAVDDAVDDDGETVTLTLGSLLPGGVSAGSTAIATVTLTDNDTVTGAPSILSVSLTSDPGGGYATGEEIEATVRFNKTVTVTGTPQLGLTVGSNTRQASYAGGAREVVTFSYEVADDETDTDGVSIAADSLTPNGGTIRDGANQNAVLTHSALADDANHRVDGVAPILQMAVVDETILTLTYDEPLAQPAPRASAFFTVAVIHPGGGRYAPEVVVDGSVMTVTLWDPVLAGEEVTVKFSNISVFGTPHLIRDLAGNPAASLREHAVTNVTKERPYDTDNDRLIEITTLAQLDAVRHDRNGDGVPTAAGASAYRAAFPDAFLEAGSQLRCVLECRGYELMADLDFDTDADGDVDADDTYWNSGAGWNPIGSSRSDFLTTFEGNGHTIRNLLIDRPSTNYAGLFGYTDWKANIRNVGLIQVNVAGRTYVGGLVGNNLGAITACYATGHVSGSNHNIGGLVGAHYGSVRTSYATAQVSGRSAVGGLVGRNLGIIIDASYATGAVAGQSSVGGLLGYEDGNTVRASYATGRVSGSSNVGGLVGGLGSSTITTSYWDTTTSGQTTGDHGSGQTTAYLQAPTDDTGIYADWDADQWDFGGTDEYPALVVDFDGDGDATWAEFGYQLRAGPTDLTVTTDTGLVELRWTAVDASHWDPAPDVTYTVYRATGSTVAAVAEDLTEAEYTDREVTRDTTYTYQVAAVVNGGEATRSGLSMEVTAPNQPPAFDDGDSTTRTIPENATGHIGLPVSATDPDDTTLIYSLDTASAAVFTVDASGQLRTQAALDHEAQPRYFVTIRVSDGKDDAGNPDPTPDATIDVTVTVTDAPGTVTVSSTRPLVGRALTATVADPDAPVSISTWRWERSAEGVTWSLIAGATTALYTPGATDHGRYLRATVTYTDAEGTAKEATSGQTQRVARRISPPPPPPPPGPGGGGGGPACAEDVHGNTAAQATDMTLDTETAGAICPAADVDYFTVTAPDRGLLFVDTISSVNTRGTIWQDGGVLASGPTSSSQQDDRLGARVQAGQVVVALRGQGGATGAYDIVVTFVRGTLENPGLASFQSGLGLLSGWVCEANVVVELEISGLDHTYRLEAAYGTDRADTEGVCGDGDTDNGFGLLFNWNLLLLDADPPRDTGVFTVRAVADGVEFGQATFTVTTLGEEFLEDVTGETVVRGFPSPGAAVRLVWQQANQNFVLAPLDGTPVESPPATEDTPEDAPVGALENPGPASFQSGLGLLSGWVCEANVVELEISGLDRTYRLEAAYSADRADTAPVCGDQDNGFGLLFNWNLLGDGEHTVVALADGVEFGRATFTVTTLGVEFLQGMQGETVVADFPSAGEAVRLIWQQANQNFVLAPFADDAAGRNGQ